MALREKWEFDFTCGRVATAANAEFERRNQREEYWLAERESVMEEIKEKGLTVELSGAGQTKMSIENRAQVSIDWKLEQKLGEIESYLKKARQEKKQYEMYAQVLSAQKSDQPIKLQPEDVFYFGLHKDFEPEFMSEEERASQQHETA